MINVRKKFLALAAAALLSLPAAHAAFAEGFGVYEWSAAATAMGEAYMFGEEDPSVLAYNPAQITKLDGTYFSIGASYVNPDTKVLFNMLGGGQEVWDNEYDPAVIPYMYYATKAGKNSWWGIAFFARYGNQIEYNDLWPGRYDTIFSGVKGVTLQPTYAFKINDKLSVGLGLDINYVKLRMRKGMNAGAINPAFASLNIGTDLEGDTINVGWVASLMYDFTPKTSMAVVYRSRIKHTMDDADMSLTGLEAFGIRGTGASGTVTLPDSLSIGLGHKFNDRTRVELNAVWTNWETYDALDIHFDPAIAFPIPGVEPISTSPNPKNWKASWRYGIGIEHKLSKQWSVLAGYVFDESPVPDDTMDFTVPTGDRHRGSLGFKYRPNENSEWVLAYTGIWAGERDVQPHSGGFQSARIYDGYTEVVSLGYTVKLK